MAESTGAFRQGAVSIKSAFQAKRWMDTPVRRPDSDKLRGATHQSAKRDRRLVRGCLSNRSSTADTSPRSSTVQRRISRVVRWR